MIQNKITKDISAGLKLKKSFTLIEILAAVIIIAVLAGFSLVSYQKTLESGDKRVCEKNLQLLQAAIDIYTLENDSLPISLSSIKPQQWQKAYARIESHHSQRNKFLAFIKNIFIIKPATAQSLPSLASYYNYEKRILRCPADKPQSPDAGYTSYNLNTSGMQDINSDGKISRYELQNSQNANTALVYDRGAYHKRPFSNETYQIAITPDKTIGIQTAVNGIVASPGTNAVIIPEPYTSSTAD